MKKSVLHWKKSDYVNDAARVLLGTFWVAFFYLRMQSGRTGGFVSYRILIFLLGLVLLLWIYSLIRKIAVPELDYTGDTLKFQSRYDAWKKRISVPAEEVEVISEGVRKGAAFGKNPDMPTFFIRLKNGKEYEYYPDAKPGKRLDEVKEFLNSCAGLPQITESD